MPHRCDGTEEAMGADHRRYEHSGGDV